MKIKLKNTLLTCTVAIALISTSCSKKDSAEEELDSLTAPAGSVASAFSLAVNLTTLPSPDTAIGEGTSSSLNLAVVGTPSALKDLEGKEDEVFFDGAVEASAASGLSDSDKDELRGKLHRGRAMCDVSRATAHALKNLSGGTICYMGKIPAVASGLVFDTVAEKYISPVDSKMLAPDIFSQEKEDKHVQIKLARDGQIGQIANIEIPGLDSSPKAYKINFYMCRKDQDTGKLSQADYAQYVINAEDKSYSLIDERLSEEDGKTEKKISTLTATLKEIDDKLAFDLSTVTTLDSKNFEDDNSSIRKVEITAGKMEFRALETHTHDGNEEKAKLFSVVNLVGKGKDTAISAMAATSLRNDETEAHGGAAEWNTNKYVNAPTHAFYDLQDKFNFTTDSFFKNVPTSIDVKLTKDCEAKGDVVVTWETSNLEFKAIDKLCGGGEDGEEDGLRKVAHNLCRSNEIHSAESNLSN